MKILLGNNTLSLLAGSETWTKTLALELKRKGHIVHGFSSDLGIIARQLEEQGIPCFDRLAGSGVKPFSVLLEDDSLHQYDVIIANHYPVVEFLRRIYPNTPIISTIHGIIHKVQDSQGRDFDAPEHPALLAEVNQFIAVSEEVQTLLKKEYNLDSLIIRNFFDLEPFTSFEMIKPTVKTILFNSNYALRDDPETKVLREVAQHYGAQLIAVGENFGLSQDLKMALQKADIVIGMGRSVLEGVCAGRLGIVHGRWGTGGVINEANIKDISQCNFSGRNSKGKIWTKEQFIEEIDRNYNQETIKWGMNMTRMNHNVSTAADFFVQLAQSLIAGKNQSQELPMKKLKFTLYDNK